MTTVKQRFTNRWWALQLGVSGWGKVNRCGKQFTQRSCRLQVLVSPAASMEC